MRINGEVWVDEGRPRLRSIRRSSVIDQWQERMNTPSRVLAPLSPMNIPHKQSDSTNFTDVSTFANVICKLSLALLLFTL